MSSHCAVYKLKTAFKTIGQFDVVCYNNQNILLNLVKFK